MTTIEDQRIKQLADGKLCIDGRVDSGDPFSGDFRLVHRVRTGDSISLYEVHCVLSGTRSRIADFRFIGQGKPLEKAVEEIRSYYVKDFASSTDEWWRRWFGPSQVSVIDTANLTILDLSHPLVWQALLRMNDLLSGSHPWIRQNIAPVQLKLQAICRESYAPMAQQTRVTVFQ